MLTNPESNTGLFASREKAGQAMRSLRKVIYGLELSNSLNRNVHTYGCAII